MFSNTPMPFEGKVAIITASTSGIGFSAAKQLVSNGAFIMISSRKKVNVEKALKELQSEYGDKKVQGRVCHVSNKEDRSNLIKETIQIFGGIDILVSNAAVNPVAGPLINCKEEEWDKIFDVNVKSTFLLTKEIFPHLISRGGGSIVYVSSISGINPSPIVGILEPYSISKTALLGLTKVMGRGLAQYNIRVNCVAPGMINTKFGASLIENKVYSEQILKYIPMKRFGLPEEIGPLIAFLCSPASSYITGEVIIVSGGMTSRL